MVAHNAQFDYGFLAQKFGRAGQRLPVAREPALARAHAKAVNCGPNGLYPQLREGVPTPCGAALMVDTLGL